ncbi:DUF262 domain-containing protein [Microcoleus sp. LAD1_D1]|uniref:DUF262 domain-containing protein n=1 Tax=Microcoleus sp. LAD1_D1 TaxID=2818812 RepID=UPI002FCF877C
MKLAPTEPDVRTIVDRIDKGDIDLQPDFQRQEVWSNSKKKKLIDTVLRGWSIPPVHLVELGDGRLEVLDGQQRLAALRDFLHNKFSVDGRITPADYLVSGLHGKFYKHLDHSTRRRVDQFPIRCFRISDYNPEEPSELFYRLNQPTILTAGEQRNALFGPARQQLKELVNLFENYGNDRETLGFSNVRLAYDDVLARLLYFLEAGNFGSKSTEARISERFRSQVPFSDVIFDRARVSIHHFSQARLRAFGYRYNKASLFSWLVFASRFDGALAPDYDMISHFVDAGRVVHNAYLLPEAVSLFNNRASLRVTDVSSVVYRDFVLCYVYFHATSSDLPNSVDVQSIKRVAQVASEIVETFESIVADNVVVEYWSQTL